MSTSPTNSVIDHLCRAARASAMADDGELLGEFVERRDEASLAMLIRRHGPMVWGACRRILSHHDAEDAFQATFLVLVHKAGAISPRAMVGNWLYGVAHQTALHARRTVARRRTREVQVKEMPDSKTEQNDQWSDVRPLLDLELSRLPEIYRAVIVFCDLEGRTRKEVAHQLGVPEGTVAGRLARARAILAKRLAARGVTLSGGALAALLAENAAPAGVPNAVMSNAIQAATLVATGQAGLVSPTVLTLTNQVLKVLTMSKVKLMGASLLAAFVMVAGIGFGLSQEKPPPAAPSEQKTSPPATKLDVPDSKWQDLLPLIDPDKHTVGKGVWRMKDAKLTAYPAAHGARLRVPVVPKGDYELRARWEPKNWQSSVAFIVPHGDRMASVEVMTGWNCAGLGDINGTRPDVNETKTPVRIEPGNVYNVAIRVTTDGANVHVVAKLDKQEIVNWKGKRSELEHEFFAPPKPASLGLAVGGDSSVFHQLDLRMINGKSEPWTPEAGKPETNNPTDPFTSRPEQSKEPFTAWGKELGGLQAGLGFRAGEKRTYQHGESVKLVLRIRNVGKEAVEFKHIWAYFIENPPTITDADGKLVQLPRAAAEGLQRPRTTKLAPGQESELHEWIFDLLPKGIRGNRELYTIHGTGKFTLQCEQIVGPTSGNPEHPNAAMSKLATGKVELEVKPGEAEN